MPFTITCPSCRHSVSVPDSPAGKSYQCPHCKAPLPAPGQSFLPESNSSEVEPWHLRFLAIKPVAAIGFFTVLGLILFVSATSAAPDFILVNLVASLLVIVGGLIFTALVLLLVDMARSLRAIRRQLEQRR